MSASFRIIPKRDFGGRPFLIDGAWVSSGFIVTHGPDHRYAGCNAMPGATWFRTIRDAVTGIRCLIAADGDGPTFWMLIRQEVPS